MRIFSLLLFLIVFSGINFCNASVNFGSRDSKIIVLSGAKLNIGGDNFTVDGTISQDAGGIITGKKFAFVNGVLEQGSAEALLNGDFDPSAVEVLQFTGDGVLRGEPGNLIYGVLISGLNNVISGQPTFVLPISLLDSSSEALVDIQNALSQPINLNGGVVRLVSDLSLGDDVQFVGPGTIDLNDRQLNLGGSYKYPWVDELVFENAASLVLTGSVKLDGIWYFNGECNLSGNGSLLDLTDGGKIVLGPDTTLYIEDLVIKGLGDSAGQIIFASDSSNVYMSKVEACLDEDFTITVGNIVVEGTSTFVLGSHDWDINTLATLTVDGVTLWLDTLGSGTATGAGHLNASRAIYDINGYNPANVSANIVDGTLTYLNGGFIKQSLTATGGFVDWVTAILLSGDVHVDLSMNYAVHVPSDKFINITGDMTLNGNGSPIIFPDSGIHQFIVQPGVTVTLVNVVLENINQNTFQIFPGGKINIGENVVWSFSEDVTFDTPLINILPGGHLTWIGVDGVKYVTLYSSTDPNQVILNIDDSTIALECIVLDGISHVSNGPNSLVHLNGESGVNVDVNSDLNFKASRTDNSLTFLTDALTLSGLIVFGDKSVNELHLAFSLFDGLSPDRLTAKERYPLLNLSGGPGIIVGGPDNGTSRLIIDDPYIVLNLLDSNSIQLDINSHLIYKELEIRTNPMKQYSTRFIDDGLRMLGRKIDTSFIRSRLSREVRLSNAGKKDILRKIADDHDVEKVSEQPVKEQTSDFESLRKITPAKPFVSKEKDPKKVREELLRNERFNRLGSSQVTRGKTKLSRVRIVEPIVYDHLYSNQYVDSTEPFAGNIEMRNSFFNNFFISSDLELDLFMKDGSGLAQGLQNISFDPVKHKVNIVGRGNIISVERVVHFSNNLFIDKNSSLEFKFVPTGYEDVCVIFDPGSVIQISENSSLIFSGIGKVILSDGVTIKLLATEDAKTKKVVDKSSLIISDGAVLDFAGGSNSKIEGIGNIIIQNASAIKPSTSGSLVIGSSESDEISVNVSGNSQICVDVPYVDGIARISMHKLVTSLNFEKGGMLIVGKNGVFELNALNGQISKGVVSELSFRNNGSLLIKDGGRFILSTNRMEYNSMRNYNFDWGGFSANISGGGFVDYLDDNRSKSFSGKVFATDPKLFEDNPEMTFDQLALLLASKMPLELQTSILYEKPDGYGVIITKNGVRVNLLQGDVIEEDGSNGVIYGTNASGHAFSISPDGKRS